MAADDEADGHLAYDGAANDRAGDHESDTPHAIIRDATIGPVETVAMVDLLERGSVEVVGRMPWSSNGTYLVQVCDDGARSPAVYKPESGERPLWDFPGGLWRREVAAWELSEVLGFGLVPPTVGRDDLPFGRGSLQAFVPARFEEHYFTLRQAGRDDLDDALRRLCVLDIVANATDRKGGHCLVDEDDRLWAIDNGLSFHAEFKLRTVIWDFAGEELEPRCREALERFCRSGVPLRLARWLDDDEVEATLSRARGLLAGGRLPHDPTGRRYPWPLV